MRRGKGRVSVNLSMVESDNIVHKEGRMSEGMNIERVRQGGREEGKKEGRKDTKRE